jgi:hypothetical protein
MTIPNYVLLALLLSANFLVFSHTRRIQELQRKIGLVLTHLGIDPTGAGLKEAVAVIDKVVAGANGASP